MKNGKTIFKAVINAVIGLILLGLYVLAVVNAYALYKGNLVLYATLLVAGIIISTFLYSLIHELGHLIIGLMAGLKFSKICVLCFLLEVENGSLKFKIVKPTEFGYTEMLPKKVENYGKKLAVSATGGLVFSLACIVVSMVICLNNLENIWLFTLFGACYPLAIYIFLINALPLFDGSDGALIFSVLLDGKNPSVLKNYYTATASVMLLKEPSLLDGKLFEFSNESVYGQNLKYLNYLRYLSTDFDKAYAEILSLSKQNIIDDNLYFIVKKELFFCKVILGENSFVQDNASAVVGDIDLSEDLCNYRVHASYRVFIKDYEFASLILQNGLNVLSNKGQNGIVKSEIAYLNELKNQLNNTQSL